MHFAKYLINSVLLGILLFASLSYATVFEKKCGNKNFIVEVYNGFCLHEKKYKLYYQEPGKEKKLFYESPRGVSLNTACINTPQKAFFLFNEGCYGNACPELIYGILDVATQKILLNPSDWNRNNDKETEKIIGRPAPFLDDEEFFCCFNREINKE